jgi:hypothetical protein
MIVYSHSEKLKKKAIEELPFDFISINVHGFVLYL